jgi:CPA1 family monovalent cation:H+ antiporter
VVALRRRTTDTIIEAALSLATPLVAYIVAERLHLSGILAAVGAGLWMGPRSHTVVEPLTRVEIQAAWRVIAFVLNSLLFLLVGLQMDSVVENVDIPFGQLALGAGAILAALLGIRVVWALMLPTVVQGARRLAGRSHGISTRGWRFALAWSGVRGSVALAAALILPAETDAGTPFPGRDLVLLITMIVIIATLVAQGLTLRPLMRALDLTDPGAVEHEEAIARTAAAEASLDLLDEASERHGLSPESRDWLRREFERRRDRYRAIAEHGGDPELERQTERITAADAELLDAGRSAVVELEARGDVRAEVAQKVLRDLDLDSARVGETVGGAEA